MLQQSKMIQFVRKTKLKNDGDLDIICLVTKTKLRSKQND